MTRNPLRSARVLFALATLAALSVLANTGCSKKTTPAALLSPDVVRSGSDLSIARPGDVAQVMQIQNRHTPELMRVAGVIGTGTASTVDGRPEILVLTQREGVRNVPASIDGVPVEVRVVGVVTPYAKPGGGGTLQCGTSTGNDNECAAGTIGCVVLKGGTKYFLSNNHVFARENAASNGERIDAPGRYDGHPICAQTPICGTLAAFKAISFSSSNTVDCAIALPDPGRAFTVAEAGGYTPTSNDVAAFVGQAVKKTGRTSRLTHGNVQAINVTIQVQYTDGVATFTGQIMTPGSFIRSGDSGSLMVEETTNNPVGLCFAGGSGGSFANPIGPVLQALGVTVASQ